ncbi:unnamed protein product [Caenorhabditis auriculariae]|uniref:Major facilitator superfamily (MFS) profile domain-containing protein n=1 Tax=Caenorhabditis auriculariae TaxID=2777116 RepID=A0A8S1HT28_9PELO|nr:unnamed protein product [Caenorhabditis auriculariae]
MAKNKVAPMESDLEKVRPTPSTTLTSSGASEFQGCWTVVVVSILFIINLLNYMDRFTIAGVLTDIQDYYHISDAWGGLIQTTFMIFFIIFSPICGFLGDRYNRKWIFVAGITIWVGAVCASTFIPSNMFWLFLLLRGVVGIGEASYAIISPTVIADMFTGVLRSRMLMVFYFAIPFGSGLGFIVGSAVDSLTGHWQWGVRVTGLLGIICLILIIAFIRDPERGKAERDRGEITASVDATNYWEDLKDLCTNATYITSTFGYTATVFMVGTLAWSQQHGRPPEQRESSSELGFFGAITCVGGIAGVAVGTIFSNMWSRGVGPFKHIQTKRADALVCAIGAFISIPTLIFAILHLSDSNMTFCWIMLFLCVLASSFNWATNVDLLLSVVIPQRRSSASSYQILISHLCGDASGPYILGLISDAIRGDDNTPYGHYHSLVTSFYLCVAMLVISVILFLAAAYTIVADQRKFAEMMG